MPVEGWVLVLGAYLLGAVPFGYLVTRVARGIDIRRYGSGNVGGSNVWATVGRGHALVTIALDISKGAVPVLAARSLDLSLFAQALAGWSAVIGHNWSAYLKLTGGRGAGTALGVLLALAPGLAAVFIGVSVALLLLLRNSPLTVGVSAVFLPLWSLLLSEPQAITLACLGLVALVMLKRLLGSGRAVSPMPLGSRRFLYRLLFDRDVPSREGWVYRRPPQQGTRGSHEGQG